MPFSAAETKPKEILKAAIIVLEERRDLVHDALADAVKDIGLARGIEVLVRRPKRSVGKERACARNG